MREERRGWAQIDCFNVDRVRAIDNQQNGRGAITSRVARDIFT